MIIREARISDIPVLQEIAVKAYEPYVSRIGCEPAPMRPDFRGHVENDIVFVADEDGAKAYAVLVIQGKAALLDNIAVDPGAQGGGFGSKLVEHLEAYLRTSRINRYELYTNVHMKENIAWYTRSGFVEVGRGKQDGFDRVFFGKEL